MRLSNCELRSINQLNIIEYFKLNLNNRSLSKSVLLFDYGKDNVTG